MNKSTGMITLLAQSDPTQSDQTGYLVLDHGLFFRCENISVSSPGARAISLGCENHFQSVLIDSSMLIPVIHFGAMHQRII